MSFIEPQYNSQLQLIQECMTVWNMFTKEHSEGHYKMIVYFKDTKLLPFQLVVFEILCHFWNNTFQTSFTSSYSGLAFRVLFGERIQQSILAFANAYFKHFCMCRITFLLSFIPFSFCRAYSRLPTFFTM